MATFFGSSLAWQSPTLVFFSHLVGHAVTLTASSTRNRPADVFLAGGVYRDNSLGVLPNDTLALALSVPHVGLLAVPGRNPFLNQ